MKLKADRVCFSTSARARVLPDRPREEIIEMAAPPRAGNMIGATRCDERVLALVRQITAGNDLVRVESAGHNKLRWFGAGGRSAVTSSTVNSDRQAEQIAAQLAEAKVIMAKGEADEVDELLTSLDTLLGIPLTTGTSYLFKQFIESLREDIDLQVLERAKVRLVEMEELLELSQQELNEIKRETQHAVAAAEHQRDEARARAEKAEKALASLTSALRGAQELVSGS